MRYTIIFHLCLISPISCWHVTRLRATPSDLQMNGKAFTILNPRSCVEIFSDYGCKNIDFSSWSLNANALYDFFSGIMDRNFFIH